MNKDNLKNLSGFCCTEQYWKHGFIPNFVYTDGVKYLCQNADCYWLLDVIGSYQHLCKRDKMLKDSQFWHLKPATRKPYPPDAVMVDAGYPTDAGILNLKSVENPVAAVICERDSDDTAIVQELEMTDFPFDVIPDLKLYVMPTSLGDGSIVWVVLLPSEY